MGFGNILKCTDRVILVVVGKEKKEILKKTLMNTISSENPASILRKHPNLTIACDIESTSELPRQWLKRYPKKKEFPPVSG
jgi:6-phosphogluconolactonase/glucosamine-6-phosphate isomerase/deaminase